jgi:FMN phosphatase YigB (HAD superfamily)
VAVSFDLFGTLLDAERPDDPAAAVARQLRERDVPIPGDWTAAYGEPHVDAPVGAEISLPEHVAGALRSRGVDPSPDTVRRAVAAAFDPVVTTRAGASEAVAAARERGPVGVCSNCSVPGLVERSLRRSAVPLDHLDAVVTSVDCGWRKPDRRAFEASATALGVAVHDLTHVGDDPRTDGGITDFGGEFVSVAEVPLAALADRLEGAP